jgi:hypothetical protein
VPRGQPRPPPDSARPLPTSCCTVHTSGGPAPHAWRACKCAEGARRARGAPHAAASGGCETRRRPGRRACTAACLAGSESAVPGAPSSELSAARSSRGRLAHSSSTAASISMSAHSGRSHAAPLGEHATGATWSALTRGASWCALTRGASWSATGAEAGSRQGTGQARSAARAQCEPSSARGARMQGIESCLLVHRISHPTLTPDLNQAAVPAPTASSSSSWSPQAPGHDSWVNMRHGHRPGASAHPSRRTGRASARAPAASPSAPSGAPCARPQSPRPRRPPRPQSPRPPPRAPPRPPPRAARAPPPSRAAAAPWAPRRPRWAGARVGMRGVRAAAGGWAACKFTRWR